MSQYYITDVSVVTGKNAKAPSGYTKIDVDLNKGAGGKYIYLVYKKGSGSTGVIDIIVVTGKNTNAPPGYTRINVDVNEDAGGDYMYLCKRFGNAGETKQYGIIDLQVLIGGKGSLPKDYTSIGIDLNRNAGGEWIYLCCKRQPSNGTYTDRALKLSNPVEAFTKVNSEGTKYFIEYNRNVTSQPSSTFTHIQGYARYRGNGYDYHIFSHSDIYSQMGHLYFISNDNQHSFMMVIPALPFKESDMQGALKSKNLWFNHPGGIQLIGDYLVVTVQGAKPTKTFGDNTIIYAVNMFPLRSHKRPYEIKEIMRLPGIAGASVGVVDAKCELPNGARASNGIKYVIAVMDGESLKIYLSNATDRFSNGLQYEYVREYKLNKMFHNIGLVCGNNGDVYMIGFHKPVAGATDTCFLYTLTKDNGTMFVDKIANVSEKHMTTSHDSVLLFHSVHFDYGAGLEIISNSQLVLYATRKDMEDKALINIFA